MSNNQKIILWSKKGCSYCQDIQSYFNEQHITYSTIDVTEHDHYRNILEEKYGVRYVPVVEISRDPHVYQALLNPDIDALRKALS
ncbi:glutaredoxin family protein [Bacillus altitudinis]|uniref:glutaredoxin family protein n=1 Tax=Bacillus TaxID=1386 RepID=UPI000BF4D1F0|nr:MULTISPECIES: glutaredoxin family protein [Bacillus]MCY7670053.1 glutaredoxin family protein [Bacillus altitudinis]PGD45663.1 NrdH-redoxin [Bacillus altitudinis]WGV01978.1 glutaredoxin family protein [Bacillus altitudinis]WHX71356.1 glutaredoxin family protein [Bacillus altitudinis]